MAKSLVEALGLQAGRVPPGAPAPRETVCMTGPAAAVLERIRDELQRRGQDPASLHLAPAAAHDPGARRIVVVAPDESLPPAPAGGPASLVIPGEDDALLPLARDRARQAVAAGGWDRIVITRPDRSVLEYTAPSPLPAPDAPLAHPGRVAAVLLAAGTSSRMGRPKQLIPVRGEPLVRHAARAALDAGLDPVLVVTGAHGDAVAAALAGLPVRLVANPAFAQGQASSMHAGIRALPPEVEAMALLLTDQPDLGAADLRALLHAWHRWPGPALVPLYDGERGSPVVFHRDTLPALLAVQGDRGGRGVLEQLHGVGFLAMPNPAAGRDLDLPSDLDPGPAGDPGHG